MKYLTLVFLSLICLNTSAQNDFKTQIALAEIDLANYTTGKAFGALPNAAGYLKDKDFNFVFLSPTGEIDESGFTVSHRRTNAQFGRREDYMRSISKMKSKGITVIQDLVIGNYSAALDLRRSYEDAFKQKEAHYELDMKSKTVSRVLSMIFRNTAQSSGVDGVRLFFEQDVSPEIINAAIVELKRLFEVVERPQILVVEGNGKYRFPEINFDVRMNEGVSAESSYFVLPAASLSNNTNYEELIKSVIRPGLPAIGLSEIDLTNDEHNWDLSNKILKLGAFHPCSQSKKAWKELNLGKGVVGFSKVLDNDVILFLKNTSTESAKFKFKNRGVRTNVIALQGGQKLRFKKKLKSSLDAGEWQLYSSAS